MRGKNAYITVLRLDSNKIFVDLVCNQQLLIMSHFAPAEIFII